MVNSREYLDQKKPSLGFWASSTEDFAFTMGPRHWGFWHDFSPVNNTCSLWASLAHYTQAYMAGTLLTEPSPRLLMLLLMSTVNHQLVVRSLWSSQCAQGLVSLDTPCTILSQSGECGKCWYDHGILHAFGKSSMRRKITVSVLCCYGWQWRWIEGSYSVLWILVWQTVKNRGPGWIMCISGSRVPGLKLVIEDLAHSAWHRSLRDWICWNASFPQLPGYSKLCSLKAKDSLMDFFSVLKKFVVHVCSSTHWGGRGVIKNHSYRQEHLDLF